MNKLFDEEVNNINLHAHKANTISGGGSKRKLSELQK